MGAWTDIAQRQATDLMSALGEMATLADESSISVVFDPIGDPGSMALSDVGLIGRVASQANPVAWAMDADVAALAKGDTVTVRGVAYVLTRPPEPDGAGISRIELMPASRSDADIGAAYR